MGVGCVIPVAAIVPAWILLPLFETPDGTLYGRGIDVKVAVGSLCLAAFCFLPKRTLPLRPVPLDFIVLALIVVHVVSDSLVSGISGMVAGRAYVEWYLPYLLGRIACQSFDDMRWIAYTVGCIAIFLGGTSLIEAIFGMNLFEVVLGNRPVEGFSREASRWGMKRAFGPTMHPIYLGVAGLLTLGWTIFLARNALRKKVHPLWLFTPLSIVGLVCFTGSRGPVLGVALALLGIAFMTRKRSRFALLVGGILCAGLLFANREAVLSQLEKWGSSGREVKTRELEVGDDTIVHSGTRNRLSILAVYETAVKRSGLFGFGTDAVSSFPINVPVGQAELKTIKQTRYIDNTYLLLTLRFGYLGVAVFVAACVVAVAQLVIVADRHQGRSPSQLATSLGGCLLAVYVVIATVWMPPDYGFLLIWTMGCSSGMYFTMRAGGFGAPTSSLESKAA
ncbi:MAG: O-antigen ligase family protein [Aureliella sp.]